jgi:hypothetical protein
MNLRNLVFCIVLFIVLSLSCSHETSDNSDYYNKEAIRQNNELIKEMTQIAADSNSAALVTLKLAGKTVPGTPKVTTADDTASALFERVGLSAEIAQTGPDTWITLLENGQTYVVGWIAEDKKLFGYLSQPFKASAGLEFTFSPGEPALFEYDLTTIPENISVFPAEVLLPIEVLSHNNVTRISWGEQQSIDKPGIIKIEGMAPGKYEIIAKSKNSKQLNNDRIPCLNDRRIIEIKPGIVNRFTPVYPKIDSTVEPGDVTIRGVIIDQDLKPVADTIVQLIPFEETNMLVDLFYPDTKTDSNGLFQFTGIRPNGNAIVKCFKAGVLFEKSIMKENADISVNVVVDPSMTMLLLQRGSQIGNVVVDYKDKTEVSLSDLGKTSVITFWSGWVPLCRENLSKLNTLAEQKNDVAFVALSVDADRNEWEKTVENSGWTKLRHGWFDYIKSSHTFNRPIPFTLILDKEGVIRSIGYNLDIATELEKLEKANN